MSNVASAKDINISEHLGGKRIASRARRLSGRIITTVFLLITLNLSVLAFLQFGASEIQAAAYGLLLASVIDIAFLSIKQQTIGMIFLKMRIASDSEKPMSKASLVFWRTLLNWSGMVIPFIAILNYLNITGNATNRCIHDELSNTIVIDTRSTTDAPVEA